MSSREPLLTPNPRRFVLLPIVHQDIWNLYKQAQSSHWTAEEIDLAGDRFGELNKDEQHFIKLVLAFFATADGIVNENLAINFMHEVQIPEARCFYGEQIAMENVHAHTYALLLDTYIRDSEERERLFCAMDTVPCVKAKAEWATHYIASADDFAVRLVAFACVEGIFFSSSFCAIYWLKKNNRMPGLAQANELIARDEGLHCKFACLLYSKLVNRLSESLIHRIVKGAVEIETDFVTDALPVRLAGMNAESMVSYVKCCADTLLEMLGYSKMYKNENPFPWMTLISLDGKTNFFEKRVSEYAKAKKSTDGFSLEEWC